MSDDQVNLMKTIKALSAHIGLVIDRVEKLQKQNSILTKCAEFYGNEDHWNGFVFMPPSELSKHAFDREPDKGRTATEALKQAGDEV